MEQHRQIKRLKIRSLYQSELLELGFSNQPTCGLQHFYKFQFLFSKYVNLQRNASRGHNSQNQLQLSDTIILLIKKTCHYNRSDDSKCLDDPPTKRDAINIDVIDKPGRVFDADDQCRQEYGENAKFCRDESNKFMDVS